MFCNLISECIRINGDVICGCPPCKYKLYDMFFCVCVLMLCTQENIMFLMLLLVYIQTGQAEKLA